MKNKAFTMAEIMIVLTLIGVLTTIMLSSMSRLSPDRKKIIFKKAYQTIERTVAELVNDESLYPYDSTSIGFKNTEKITWPGSNEEYSGGNKFINLFKRKLNIIDEYRNNNNVLYFLTSDGIAYHIDASTFTGTSSDETTISVDTNGEDGPNCGRNASNVLSTGCNEGNQDIFRVFVSYDGKVTVEDPLAIEYLKSTNAR